jgi:hypothetical protein
MLSNNNIDIDNEIQTIKNEIEINDTKSCGRYLSMDNASHICELSKRAKKIKKRSFISRISPTSIEGIITVFIAIGFLGAIGNSIVKFTQSTVTLHNDIQELKSDHYYDVYNGSEKAEWFKEKGYVEFNLQNPISWFFAELLFIFTALVNIPTLSLTGLSFFLLVFKDAYDFTSKYQPKELIREMVVLVDELDHPNLSLHPMEVDIINEISEMIDTITFSKDDVDYHEMFIKKTYIHDKLLQMSSDHMR